MASKANVLRRLQEPSNFKRKSGSSSRRHLAFFLVLLVPSILPFLPAVIGDFVWVDHAEIERRGYLVLSWRDSQDVWRMTLEQYMSRGSDDMPSQGGYFRPLYALGITASYHLYGLDPVAFHLENLAWHAVVVWGLYLIAIQWGATRATSVVAAACFAVHPLTVTSVSWISGRKDLMCAAFGVWAVLCVLQSLSSRQVLARLAWSAVALLLTAASILSKELGVVVPLVALLAVGHRFLNSRGRQPVDAPRADGRHKIHCLISIGLLTSMCLAAAAMFWFRANRLGGIGLNASYPHDSWWANLVNSCQLVWTYVGRVLLPSDPRISDAWNAELPVVSIQVGWVVATLFVILGVGLGFLRRQKIATSLLWFLIWLLPAMGMVPLRHWYAERYLYPASWGIVIGVCLAIRKFLYRYPQQIETWDSPSLPADVRVSQERLREGAMYLLGGLLVVLIGIPTTLSNRFWMNDRTLFEHAVDVDPNYLEGRVALSSDALRNDRLQVAIDQGEEAIRRADTQANLIAYWSPYIGRTNLGLAYLRAGRAAEAIEQFQIIKANWPDDSPTDFHLGQAFLANGQPALAERAFARRLQDVPNDFAAQSNLALSYLLQQQFDEAIQRLEPLVEASPDDVTNRINLVNAYLANQQFEQAYSVLAKLFSERKEDPIVIAKLAYVLFELGQLERAEQVIVHGLRVAPDDPLIRSNADRIREAVERGRKAQEAGAAERY